VSISGSGGAIRLTAVFKKTWFRRTATILVYVLLVGFLAWTIYGINWSSLSKVSFNFGFLALALVTGLGFRYWQTFIWITVLRGLGARNVRMNSELIYVYAKSWLGRYIPGTAPWILGKIFFASKHGVSKTKLAVGSLLEAAIQIAVLLSTSSILLLLDPRLNIPSVEFLRPIMVAVVVACVIGLLPPIFNRLMALAFRILRRPPLSRENYASWRTIGTATGQYVIGAFLSGGSLFYIAAAIYPQLGYENFFFVVAAGNLAGAVSMLIIFIPSGIGVREGVQLGLLKVIMPAAIATAAVVLTRVWTIVMDLLFFAISWVILVVKRGRNSVKTLDTPADADIDHRLVDAAPTESAATAE
jgi:uncharacterized membrane protein YbhN (UPF0104 family)